MARFPGSGEGRRAKAGSGIVEAKALYLPHFDEVCPRPSGKLFGGVPLRQSEADDLHVDLVILLHVERPGFFPGMPTPTHVSGMAG
jgi:hypothetical protein